MSEISLDGRVVAIAGVAGGLGPVVAERLAAAGATIAGADVSQEHADAVGVELGLPAERWDGRAVDLLDEEATRAWCAALLERFGRVDALLHLVGGWRGGQPLHEEPLEDWALLHDLLIRTVQHTTRAFHDALLAGESGRFVLVSAKQAQAPSNSNAAYAAAKAAAEAWTLALADGFEGTGGDRQHHRRRRDPHSAHAGGEPGRGFPHLHPGRGARRRDRISLLGPGQKDERAAFAAYDAGMSKPHDGEMTISELAERTGMTVRNIRAHQTRGLLPPPVVRGRTGYYNEEHVARIELTREMQAEGLNLEAIRRMAESVNGAAEEIVGFTRTLRAPFEEEAPEIVDLVELAELWKKEVEEGRGFEMLERGEKLGTIRSLPDGKVEVISPRMMNAAAALAESA